jgi:hypothetical protein
MVVQDTLASFSDAKSKTAVELWTRAWTRGRVSWLVSAVLGGRSGIAYVIVPIASLRAKLFA